MSNMVKICPNCGIQINDKLALFCNKCGAQIPEGFGVSSQKCKKCGTIAQDDQSLFCNKCGAPFQKIDNQNVSIKQKSPLKVERAPADSIPRKYSHIPLVADDTKKQMNIKDEQISFNIAQTIPKKNVTSTKSVQETKCTCQSCGKIWYYGKKELWQNRGNKLSNFSKDMYACSCCFPLAFLKGKDVVDLDRCPNCGSKGITKEEVTHEVV